MRFPAALLLLLPASCMASPAKTAAPRVQADLQEEAARPDAAAWHVHVDARGKLLGAYTLTLRFDAAVAAIEDVQACNVRHFHGAPVFDPATFRSGRTRVVGLDANPSMPDGDYHLLTVTFRRLAPGRLRATAEIENAYDGDNKPLAGARITLPRFEHEFR